MIQKNVIPRIRSLLYSTTTVAIVLLGIAHSVGRAEDAKKNSLPSKPCIALGDTITIVGRNNSWTSIDMLDSMCVLYPDSSHRATTLHMPIVDPQRIFNDYLSKNKIRLGTYLEVTGVIVDGFQSHDPLVALDISAVRNVNEQVLQLFDRRAADCEQWQNEHKDELIQKANGAAPSLVTYNARDGSGKCGMWAIDKALPHQTITLWRTDPEQSYASLLAGMPAPTAPASTTDFDGRMIINGLPELPEGCTGPIIVKKHELQITAHYSKQEITKDSTDESNIITGGQVEADIIIDGRGRSGGSDAQWLKIAYPVSSSAGALERSLSADLQSWLWKPASCTGAALQHLYPQTRLVQTNNYSVYALAHIHYDFVRTAIDHILVKTEITLGNTKGCQRLKLADAPEPRHSVIGATAPYLICADLGSPK